MPSIVNARPVSRIVFTPSADQSAIFHFNVRVNDVIPQSGGWRRLSVTSGNVGFYITVPPDMPIRAGDRLILEFPKGSDEGGNEGVFEGWGRS